MLFMHVFTEGFLGVLFSPFFIVVEFNVSVNKIEWSIETDVEEILSQQAINNIYRHSDRNDHLIFYFKIHIYPDNGQ